MATYIKIAPQETNLGGIASKGYVIYRKQRIVNIKWGAIKSIIRKFYWAGINLPVERSTSFRTIEEAKNYFDEKIRRINRQEYKKLPAGKRIMKNKNS